MSGKYVILREVDDIEMTIEHGTDAAHANGRANESSCTISGPDSQGRVKHEVKVYNHNVNVAVTYAIDEYFRAKEEIEKRLYLDRDLV